MRIQPEIASYIPFIRLVHEQAFRGPNEAKLVNLLRRNGKATVSLVALVDGRLVGHIQFSPVTLNPPVAGLRGLGLAPVGVLPEFQRQGAGSRLIREGLEVCHRQGCNFVVVLGHPEYYSRFGFRRASFFGLDNEYGVDEEFMALELKPGCLEDIHGIVKYQSEFNELGC